MIFFVLIYFLCCYIAFFYKYGKDFFYVAKYKKSLLFRILKVFLSFGFLVSADLLAERFTFFIILSTAFVCIFKTSLLHILSPIWRHILYRSLRTHSVLFVQSLYFLQLSYSSALVCRYLAHILRFAKSYIRKIVNWFETLHSWNFWNVNI